jgi:hypothetical protein
LSIAAAGAGGEALTGRGHHSDGDPLARVVFGALLLACFLAFFLTQRLKHTPTVVKDIKLTTYFSPFPSGHVKEESISFKLDRAERVTVEIEDTSEAVVATLLSSYSVPRYKQFSLRWNGRRGLARGYAVTRTSRGHAIFLPRTSGPIAAPGEYRVRLVLARQHRIVRSTRNFTLVEG